MGKIKVYVYSSEISTLGFVDKEGAQHACAKAGSSAFTGLQHYGGMSNRYLSDNEKATVRAVEEFCKKRDGVEFEIVDLALAGYLSKARFWLKGLRSLPVVTFGESMTHGVPSEKDLEKLVAT
ncbi:MAG: hypothetical protein WCC63_02320 [Candidatus Bathyarchaeia archaeon]